MIQLLATRYPKHISYTLLMIFLAALKVPAYGNTAPGKPSYTYGNTISTSSSVKNTSDQFTAGREAEKRATFSNPDKTGIAHTHASSKKVDIGGPTQPEMSSFKSVGTDNMVNLFTGDFSYNIPLLDVGGYPVNIFYDGSVSMEQDASWVGLGWNINPGNVNRNMRGVPDDFNGKDTLTQTQMMKPNNTWGASAGYDLELIGVKNLKDIVTGSVGVSLGMSFNNYLGPAIDLGVKGGVSFKIAGKASSEKSGFAVGGGLGANVSSRSGVTLSSNVSLTANSFANIKRLTAGLGLSTSYNSKTGIKALQISEQMSYNYGIAKLPASLSTAISFAKPSYIPAIRIPLTNEAYAGHFQLGVGFFGVYGSMEGEGYRQTSYVAEGDMVQKKALVGYLHYEKAGANPNAVTDFTRFNDNEITPNTPIISAPQYAYDVFSIQGEGTGGSIRAYRNDPGYVRDNATNSEDKSLSIGADVGTGHFGANFSKVQTPTFIGEWRNGNRLRGSSIAFKDAIGLEENVYFRNPGESSVLNENQFKKIGGTDLVRFQLGGTDANPTVEPVLEQFSKAGVLTGTTRMTTPDLQERKKRTQVVSFLTAQEAAAIGLNPAIKSYKPALSAGNNLEYEAIPRVSEYRKEHHISQINVTEAGGMRYVYDIPVYNNVQKDFSFSVNTTEGDVDKDYVPFAPLDATTGSALVKKNSKKDGFVQITETPPYAHSFLLSGLLSADYVDVTGNGVTEDDLGGAVKFNYTRIKNDNGTWADHRWRTPHTAAGMASFHAGNLTEIKDDKALISYGERESWYVHSIESKTMIALFSLENRKDGKGASGPLGGINNGDKSQKRLKKIDLYSKADLKKNGLAGARPVKTVWFAYSYSLCAGIPGNNGEAEQFNGAGANLNAARGKLTLDSIYFTFNGKNRVSKNKYVFSYTDQGKGNPAYEPNASDRWGNYKPKSMNPGGIKNAAYPYSIQDPLKTDASGATLKENAGAWALKKILLPSGGQIEVAYESDDYAFVQNRRAASMMEIAGLGNSPTSMTNRFYSLSGFTVLENDYVFIKVPEPCASKTEVFEKYLSGLSQLAFKLSVQMPKGPEYVSAYGTIADYGVYDATRIWVRINKVGALSPLCLAALDYLRERLPGQAFEGYDISESEGLKQIGHMLMGWLDNARGAFKDPIKYLHSKGKVKVIEPAKSFVRLNDPDGYKYGGGQRVKSVKLKDNWKAMTRQYTSEYGQEYAYTTTEIFNGKARTISSGVASYEPGIGSEENPFQSIVQVSDKLPLGPASRGAIEMPVLDAFFPAPVVGYSTVTVRSLRKGAVDPTKKSRSGVGRQVTEFYTAKDFPVYYNHTSFDPTSDKQENIPSKLNFWNKYSLDSRALSQGFIVETNDMHGKMKAQSSYGENDPATRINYTQNFYRNTGSRGLAEKFDFVYAREGGVIREGNMGIDVELMSDTREFSVTSSSLEIQGQVDLFPFLAPVWIPFIWPVSANSENTYRAVTTTKVISYHSILDSVVVIDKGSMVATKNLVYDAETGGVVVNRTNNEFDSPVYSTSYPAWWAYSGMGLAYKNINAVYAGANFLDGKLTNATALGIDPKKTFESGDELYIKPGNDGTDCTTKLASPDSIKLIWAFNKNKNTLSLTDPAPDFIFLDNKGKPYTKNGVWCRIVRSGKRNMLDATAGSVVSMTAPFSTVNGERKLLVNSGSSVINASAAEYKEKWQTDNEVIKTYAGVYNSTTCTYSEVESCEGYLEKSLNPYVKGLLGTYRPWRSLVFYENRKEENPTAATDISKNGFLKNFKLYWDFNAGNNLVPDVTNVKWVWNSLLTRVNAKGQELETKDALNIYTSAQYGYNKTMPVGVMQNARYGEAASEGFEDGTYTEDINAGNQTSCDNKKYLSFSGLANSSIVTDAAHSGNYSLKVNSNTSSTKTIDLRSGAVENFLLTTTKDTTKSLHELGGNFRVIGTTIPINSLANNWGSSALYNSSNTSTSIGGSLNDSISGAYRYRDYKVQWDTYINITQSGNYTFYHGITTAAPCDPDAYPIFDVAILDINNQRVGNLFNTPTNAGSCCTTGCTNYDRKSQTIFLCKGIYHLIGTALERYRGGSSGSNSTSRTYYWECPSSLSPLYKSLSTINGCIFTKPIPGNSDMLNPTFAVTPDKKMLFSTWVKEACAGSTGACNKVVLGFGNGASTTLVPTGPVIEGWQKIEGEFTVPAAATAMTVEFVNNSGQPAYYDDIRIHPYNANMKTFVYDPINLRLVAELDANNYASFYEYDEEGGLIRTKAETKEGVKTINETRSFKQRKITELQ